MKTQVWKKWKDKKVTEGGGTDRERYEISSFPVCSLKSWRGQQITFRNSPKLKWKLSFGTVNFACIFVKSGKSLSACSLTYFRASRHSQLRWCLFQKDQQTASHGSSRTNLSFTRQCVQNYVLPSTTFTVFFSILPQSFFPQRICEITGETVHQKCLRM